MPNSKWLPEWDHWYPRNNLDWRKKSMKATSGQHIGLEIQMATNMKFIKTEQSLMWI